MAEYPPAALRAKEERLSQTFRSGGESMGRSEGRDGDCGKEEAPRSDPVCPHCRGLLTQRPKRKKKCPLCGRYIFVRTTPTTRERILVTEEEAERIDEEWLRLSFRKEWLRRLEQFGVTEADFATQKRVLAGRVGEKASDRDVIWSLFNTAVTKTHELGMLKFLYYTMALFVDEEGRDATYLLKESARTELLMYREGGRDRIRISTARERSCDSCRNLEGQTVAIEQAFDSMPIPNKDCAFHLSSAEWAFCRCTYFPVVDLGWISERRAKPH